MYKSKRIFNLKQYYFIISRLQNMEGVELTKINVMITTTAQAKLDILHREADKQNLSIAKHYLPQIFRYILGKGFKWNSKKNAFYDDKFICIEPSQGKMILDLIIEAKSKYIVEFGTSYGVSTIYLASGAMANGGKVISTEMVTTKIIKAREKLLEANLMDYVDIWKGDARETLKDLSHGVDFVLLDGFPDVAFEVFKIIEPKLSHKATIVMDNINTFKSTLQPLIDYVSDAQNGYGTQMLNLKQGTLIVRKS